MKLNVEKGKQGFQEVERFEVKGVILGPDPEQMEYVDRMHEVADGYVMSLDYEKGQAFLDRHWQHTGGIDPEMTLDDAVYDTAHSVAASAIRGGAVEDGLWFALEDGDERW